jgi:hypothetical protein
LQINSDQIRCLEPTQFASEASAFAVNATASPALQLSATVRAPT